MVKSLPEFLAEHLDKLILTTAQKLKEKPLDENSRGKKTVVEKTESSCEKGNQKTEKLS